MSRLVKDDDLERTVHLMYTDDENIGTFQILQCDVHGDVLHFTDYSGANNCIRCIERDMFDELAKRSEE